MLYGVMELNSVAATETSLLNSDNDTAAPEKTASPQEASGSEQDSEWRCSPSSWDWKKLLLTACLWWAYFLINGAHSMIAPFFPNEVI